VTAVEQLKPGTLVRFRCMVQNMYDPEMYLAEYDHVNIATGERIRMHAHYCDVTHEAPCGFKTDMSDAVAKFSDRTPMHCMGIPHESTWVSECCRSAVAGLECPTGMQRDNKRSLVDGNSEGSKPTKRSHAEDAMDDEADAPAGPASAVSTHCGMECDDSSCKGGEAVNDAARHNGAAPSGRPALVPGAPHARHAAIVKIYQEDSSIKVNEAYEFVGIYSCDPVADAPEEEPGMICSFADMSEPGAVCAASSATGPGSSSVIPRIHAISFQKLSPKWNPALSCLAPAEQALVKAQVAASLPAVRARVVGMLSQVLLGDALAAEYLLCHMLSHIKSRAVNLPVGKLSLAITGLPSGGTTSQELVAVMQGLLPAVAHVPMSTKHLSARLMAPKKDYKTEMLQTGDLQVAPSTQLVCDETVMEAGQLNEIGLRNLHCLQQLASFQHIIFDFQYYQMEFLTDVPVLVTSNGKPLMTTDVVLKLNPAAAAPQAADAVPDAADAQQLCRIYMGMARSTEADITDELSTVAQEQFVQARKADASVQQDTLMNWVTLARLVAASYGATQVTKEHWDQMMAMEAQRAARVAM